MRNKIMVSVLTMLVMVFMFGCSGGGGDESVVPEMPSNEEVVTTSKIIISADLTSAKGSFKSFSVNIDKLYWQNFTDLTNIKTEEKEININEEYLYEFNGQLVDGTWLASKDSYCRDNLVGAKINFAIDGKKFELKIADLNWRINKDGGANLAIYGTYDGQVMVWKKYVSDIVVPEETKLVVVRVKFPSTAKFQIFQINVVGLFWKQFDDAVCLTDIQTTNISVQKNKQYELQINGQTDNGYWLANELGINDTLLETIDSIAIVSVADALPPFPVSASDWTWRSNDQGGGNLVIKFKFVDESIVFEKI